MGIKGITLYQYLFSRKVMFYFTHQIVHEESLATEILQMCSGVFFFFTLIKSQIQNFFPLGMFSLLHDYWGAICFVPEDEIGTKYVSMKTNKMQTNREQRDCLDHLQPSQN